jgi:transposase-like protein
MGTPNKYKKEFALVAEEILSEGKSLAAVCAHFSIARTTLYEWREHHEEFRNAVESGLQKAQAVWEDIGMHGIKGNYEKFGAAPWIFTMKNRFRADYAEEKEEKKISDEQSVLEKIISGDLKIKNAS